MALFQGREVAILGTGAYVPSRVLTNDELSQMVETSDEWILARTGIRERHIAEPGELTTDLAEKASLQALENAGVEADEIDMIIVATNTPDTVFPGVGPKLQGRLNAPEAGAFDLQAGCTSCIYALSVGAAGIASGLWTKVLVIGAEVLSRVINWEDRNTCVLFGDGAGAVLLGPSDGSSGRLLSAELRADGTKHDYITLPGGLVENPASEQTLADGLHYVHMKGNEVFKFVNRILPDFLKELCRESGFSPDNIDWWIFHQANLRIIEGVTKRLEVSTEKAVINLDQYGNTSAASTLIALHEARSDGRIRREDKVLLTSFGAGMTFGAVLYKA